MRLRLDKFMGWAMLAITFYFYSPNYWRSIWWDKWFLLMAALTFFWAVKLGRRFHLTVGLLAMILMGSALWSFAWRPAYEMLDHDVQLAVKEIGAYAFVAFSMLSVIAFFADSTFYKSMLAFIPWIYGLNSLYIIGQWICSVPAQARGGFFGNPSMSGCLLAFSLPLVLYKDGDRTRIEGEDNAFTAFMSISLLTITIAAIYLTGASQPVGVLVVVILAWWWCGSRPSFRDLCAGSFLLIFLGLVFLSFSTYRPHEGMFDSSGRMAVWREGLAWWWAPQHTLGTVTLPSHRWFGQGTGISQLLLPLIQRDNLRVLYQGQHLDWWMWFHSDWVQLLFENGIVGLTSGVMMYLFALRISWGKAPWLFAAVVGMGCTALFNFPVHFPMHAFLCVLIFGMVFDKKVVARDLYL